MSASWWSSLTFLCMNKCEKQNCRFTQVSAVSVWSCYERVGGATEPKLSASVEKMLVQIQPRNQSAHARHELQTCVTFHCPSGFTSPLNERLPSKTELYKVYSWSCEQRNVFLKRSFMVRMFEGVEVQPEENCTGCYGADTLKQADRILQHPNFS